MARGTAHRFANAIGSHSLPLLRETVRRSNLLELDQVVDAFCRTQSTQDLPPYKAYLFAKHLWGVHPLAAKTFTHHTPQVWEYVKRMKTQTANAQWMETFLHKILRHDPCVLEQWVDNTPSSIQEEVWARLQRNVLHDTSLVALLTPSSLAALQRFAPFFLPTVLATCQRTVDRYNATQHGALSLGEIKEDVDEFLSSLYHTPNCSPSFLTVTPHTFMELLMTHFTPKGAANMHHRCKVIQVAGTLFFLNHLLKQGHDGWLDGLVNALHACLPTSPELQDQTLALLNERVEQHRTKQQILLALGGTHGSTSYRRM